MTILKRSGILLCSGLGLLMALLIGISDAGAQSAPLKVDSGDTAWVLVSSAFVLAMLMPGLALFYGGLVRTKNVLATIMQSIMILSVVSVLWVLFGYSLAFGPDKGGVIGGLDWVGLSGVGAEPHPIYGPTISSPGVRVVSADVCGHHSGIDHGRLCRTEAFCVGRAVRGDLVDRGLCAAGALDLGWGMVGQTGRLGFCRRSRPFHISSGASARACAIILGKRRGYGTDYMAPHNLPMTLLGTGFLWFGWFGFNGGSALGANGIAVSAILATHTAAAMGSMAWCGVEWAHRGKPTVLGVASGAVAGLATVTPAAGYISPLFALAIGTVAGMACYAAIVWKGRFGYDDSLDVVGIHGVGGVIGILATGLCASKLINPAGADGLFYGNPGLLGVQLLVVVVTAIFSMVGTFVILKLVDSTTGLRVSSRGSDRTGFEST